jgi:hypothetical protein
MRQGWVEYEEEEREEVGEEEKMDPLVKPENDEAFLGVDGVFGG